MYMFFILLLLLLLLLLLHRLINRRLAEFTFDGFSVETCRSLVATKDVNTFAFLFYTSLYFAMILRKIRFL